MSTTIYRTLKQSLRPLCENANLKVRVRCSLKWRVEIKYLLKDVCTHCYRTSLVRTLFIGHACATSFSTSLVRTLFIGYACAKSFSSARTDLKTQQNIQRMTFALTWCANIFVGCSVTPTFFRQITSFCDSFHYTKKQKKSVRGKF